MEAIAMESMFGQGRERGREGRESGEKERSHASAAFHVHSYSASFSIFPFASERP